MTIGEKIKDIDNEINKLINSDSLSLDMCRNITYLISAKTVFKKALQKSNINLPQSEEMPVNANFYAPVNELKDIAPNLNTFIQNHTADNLQRLCIEIKEFCQAVYALTNSDEERKIYFNMVDSLKF